LFFTGLRAAFLSFAGLLAKPFADSGTAGMAASARFMAI
jgi:hypothetical protein